MKDELFHRAMLQILDHAQDLGEPKLPLEDPYYQNIFAAIKALEQNHEFYYLVDLKQRKVTWQFNIERWLGYGMESVEHLKSIGFYASLVHPFVRDWYVYYALAMYRILGDIKDFYGEPMKSTYVLNLPIRKANGSYVFVKLIRFMLQSDANGNMVSHLNCGHVVDGYRGHPLRPRFFMDGIRQETIEDRVLMEAARYVQLPKEAELTKDELKLLNLYYDLRHEEASVRADTINAEFGHISERGLAKKREIINRKMRVLMKLDDDSLKNYKADEAQHSPNGESSNAHRCLPKFNDTFQIACFLGHSGILKVLEYRMANSVQGN